MRRAVRGLQAPCGKDGDAKLSSVGTVPVGNVPVEEVWKQLAGTPRSALIDVRTRAEWTFVGVPDLTSLGKKPLLIEWQAFPSTGSNPEFVGALQEALISIGADRDWDLYFICRSGARSLSAAKAMAATGYKRCHNAAEGFEGPLDGSRRRGQVSGWKAAGLPWIQS